MKKKKQIKWPSLKTIFIICGFLGIGTSAGVGGYNAKETENVQVEITNIDEKELINNLQDLLDSKFEYQKEKDEVQDYKIKLLGEKNELKNNAILWNINNLRDSIIQIRKKLQKIEFHQADQIVYSY